MKAIPLILILTLLALVSVNQVKPGPMVGYTGFYLLPMLDGGVLTYQEGEELWAMIPDRAATITLTSPSGASTTISLEAGKPILLKTFEPEDERGNWTLSWENTRLTLTYLEEPGAADPVLISYALAGGWLEAKLETEGEAFFLDPVRDGMILLAAGSEQQIPLKELGLPGGEVVLDLIYPGGLKYRGRLSGRPYELDVEAVAGRLVGFWRKGTLTLRLPNLHEVGAGGIVPLRRGEAIMRIHGEKETTEIKVYVTGPEFAEWGGVKVARTLHIPLQDALNQTLRIIALKTDGRVQRLFSKPPLTEIRLRDQLGRLVGNLTIDAAGFQAEALDGEAYLLLSEKEIPHEREIASKIERRVMVKLYVNGFKSLSSVLPLRAGEKSQLNLTLHKLSIQVVRTDGSPVSNPLFTINNISLSLKNYSTSILLPPGHYKIAARLDGGYVKAEINLIYDTSITLKVPETISLAEALKTVALAEAMTASALLFLLARERVRK